MAGPLGGSGARKRPSTCPSSELGQAVKKMPVAETWVPAPPATAAPLPPPPPWTPPLRAGVPLPPPGSSRSPVGTPSTPVEASSCIGYVGAVGPPLSEALRADANLAMENSRWCLGNRHSLASSVPQAQFGNAAWGATISACMLTTPSRAQPRRRRPRRRSPKSAGLALLEAVSTPRVALLLPAPFGCLFPRGLLAVLPLRRLHSRSRSSPAGACAASSPRQACRVARGAIRRDARVRLPQRPWSTRTRPP